MQDKLDFSPYAVGSWSQWHTSDNFSVIVQDRSRPVYVNVQVQPQVSDHLRMALKSLDWPADSQGNMQDRNNTSDDLTLIPMLEYTAEGSPPYLPTDKAALTPYGISMDAGNHRLYAPLSLADDGGTPAAFTAKFFFPPDATSNNYQIKGHFRLVWIVQGKVDNENENDKVSVVVTYRDDFRITGMTVSQQEGTDVAEVYINPAANPEEDGPLAAALNILEATFTSYLTPTIGDLDSSLFASWGITTPGHLSDTLLASKINATHQDAAMAQATMTTTPQVILSQYSQSITPTVLIAYETRLRNQSLEGLQTAGTITATNLAFNLNNSEQLTERGLALHKYRYVNDEWQVLDGEQLLAEIDRRLANDPDITDGERFIAKI